MDSLSVDEAAAYLGFDPERIAGLIDGGALPAELTVAALDEYLERFQVPTDRLAPRRRPRST